MVIVEFICVIIDGCSLSCSSSSNNGIVLWEKSFRVLEYII